MADNDSLAERLRRRIVSDITADALGAGARLGGERDLAERYGVSRSTLRHVLAGLAEAGVVRRVGGRGGGTFVAHPPVERDLTKVVSVPAYLASQGFSAGTRILSTHFEPASPSVQRALEQPGGALVHVIRRLRLADGAPMSVEEARFPVERFPDLLERPLGGSLYALMTDHYGVVPSNADEVVEVAQATRREAEVLGVADGAPLLAVTRTCVDQDGVPFEYSYDLFRADRTRIRMRTPGAGLQSPSSVFADDGLEFAIAAEWTGTD